MSTYSAVSHPLGPPTYSGTTVTVETMLQQPTRITKMLMDITLQRFIADRVFASGGGVSGGAVVYDVQSANELYLDRDVQEVTPSSEFPIVTSSRRAPETATVRKWGAKVFITDEARDRNDGTAFMNQLRQLANTQVRKINQNAIATMEASITASSQTFAGRNWSTVVVGGSSQSNVDQFPARDFMLAIQSADEDELGIEYNLALINPQEATRLGLIYGPGWRGIISGLVEGGMTIVVSNRVAAGVMYILAEKQVGEMRIEKPLGTATWREEKTERTWVQSSVRPVMFVNNPYAVIKVTGLAG